MSSAQKSEVKAWEEEIVSCTHTTNLVQPDSKHIEKAGKVFKHSYLTFFPSS